MHRFNLPVNKLPAVFVATNSFNRIQGGKRLDT
jgi:hypothetical protein